MLEKIPNYDKLLSTLKKFGVESTQDQNLFLENCEIKCYSKNDILFSVDKKNYKEYFLIEGILHRFNINEKSENVTTDFYMGNVVITPHFARTKNGKSIFSLQALTDILIIEIPVDVLDNLRFTNEYYKTFGKKVIEEELSKSIFTDIIFRSNTAKERLLSFRSTYPNLENLIPHNIIASYLGITKVSFSRLRSEFTKK